MSRERAVVYVTGGARSGKSAFAQRLAEGWGGSLLYVATGEARDAEMVRRIEAHQRDRGPRWETLEEPLDLVAALARAAGHGGALLDCLTLWTSNLLAACGEDEAALRRRVDAFLAALEGFEGRLCVVTNEVGLGIVPENALARRFRDLAGRINQDVAARATEAHLVVSGLPLRLK
ncbi:MAG: bifunctional adenosylcobinamide kinase/adenosylcobinamide-phosphate guanylyltransferase [Deltaproteobacteria bacterium]|nr:bifunctional adenosylcobinamide kinase/adenosylcobinamide-phosphate guanylyltransferase [Deltaproteobacteria bacterium]